LQTRLRRMRRLSNEELIRDIIDAFTTTERQRVLFANLRKSITKVRTLYYRKQYDKAIAEIVIITAILTMFKRYMELVKKGNNRKER